MIVDIADIACKLVCRQAATGLSRYLCSLAALHKAIPKLRRYESEKVKAKAPRSLFFLIPFSLLIQHLGMSENGVYPQ